MIDKIWQASILNTLDLNSDTVSIDPRRALLLREGLLQYGANKYYLLTVEAGYELEIIKVCYVSSDGVLLIKRGQEGTEHCVWPAGTVLKAMISAKTVGDLQLDLNTILRENPETKLSPSGDLIIKEL